MALTDGVGPRSRNAANTRASILESARRRFAREGYDGASLREIAADARVDAALISRYFGSKDELFAEVVAVACEPNPEMFGGDPGDFGARMAKTVLEDPQDGAKLDMFLIMLLSASSPKASEIVRRCSRDKFFTFFQAWLGGPDVEVRTRLASSLMMGASLSRLIDETQELDAAGRKKLQTRLAKVLQACIEP